MGESRRSESSKDDGTDSYCDHWNNGSDVWSRLDYGGIGNGTRRDTFRTYIGGWPARIKGINRCYKL